jgi:hypothetical protein
VLIEQQLRRSAGDHRIRDLVGVPFVGVAGLADSALQLDATALLDDVRGLVRRSVEIRRVSERDVIAGGERLRSHRGSALARGRARVPLDVRDVVVAEGALDRVEVR